MPSGIIAEARESQSGNVGLLNETDTVKYRIHGSPTALDAKQALIAQAPTTRTGTTATMIANKYNVDALADTGGWFNASVVYAMPDYQKATGETALAFDTTGGTKHISYSKGNITRLRGSSGTNTAPDLGGAINVSGTEIGGCEITVPAFAFTATTYLASGCATASFIDALYNATGMVNESAWNPIIDGIELQFLAKEVLFLGASGAKRGIGDVELGLHFAAGVNVTNQTVAQFTFAANAFDYVWIVPIPQTQGSGSNVTLLCGIQCLYVERVYDDTDFSVYGLPHA